MSKTEANLTATSIIPTSIAPWLSVSDGVGAIAFYETAFGAVQTYRLDVPDGGVVAKLSVDGAEFWLSGDPSGNDTLGAQSIAECSVRMILTVSDPDTFFEKALEAGASQVFAVSEEHGWRLGRLADPFGYHWEVGRPLL